MNEKTRTFLRNLGAGALIAALVFWMDATREYGVLRCLCDAFFVAAVMLLGVGGIRAVSNQGVFDVMGFGLKYTVELVLPFLRSDEKEDIHQYRERKAGGRKSAREILLAGTVYLVLSVVVLVFYALLP